MATDTIRIIYGRAAVGTLTADIYPVGSLTALATGATVSSTAATGVFTFPAVDPTAGTTYAYHLKDSGVSGQLVAYGFFVAQNATATIEELDLHSALRPTVDQRTLDISSGGEAGIDLGNVGNPTTTVNLSGLTIKAVTDNVSFAAASIRTAVGLASANLDTQLADLPTASELTDEIDTLPTAAEIFAAVLTTAMTESYAADGVAPTLAQAVFLIQQGIGEAAISGTTKTVKKLDGSTTAATFTLDDASNPTSITRAT